MLMFYRKTTLVCARVYKIFIDGGCGCGCGANRRGASVSIGPNHSTHLSALSHPPPASLSLSPSPRPPPAAFLLQYSSQRRTTLLSYPTLSYPVLLYNGGRYTHQLEIVTSVETYTATFHVMRAHSLTAPPGGARISLCYLKTSVHVQTRVCNEHEKKEIIMHLNQLRIFSIYHCKTNYLFGSYGTEKIEISRNYQIYCIYTMTTRNVYYCNYVLIN